MANIPCCAAESGGNKPPVFQPYQGTETETETETEIIIRQFNNQTDLVTKILGNNPSWFQDPQFIYKLDAQSLQKSLSINGFNLDTAAEQLTLVLVTMGSIIDSAEKLKAKYESWGFLSAGKYWYKNEIKNLGDNIIDKKRQMKVINDIITMINLFITRVSETRTDKIERGARSLLGLERNPQTRLSLPGGVPPSNTPTRFSQARSRLASNMRTGATGMAVASAAQDPSAAATGALACALRKGAGWIDPVN